MKTGRLFGRDRFFEQSTVQLAELNRGLEQLGRSNSTAGAEETLTLVETEMTCVTATLESEARIENVGETVLSER